MIVYPNAKINIGLSITSKRVDGFHDLETIFYPTKFTDILEVVELKDEKGTYQFTSSGIDIDCVDEENLVVKAYKMLHSDYQLPAVKIHLHKNIPFGAGLGGGSADASFMLMLLNNLFELDIEETKLLEYAAELGSDCPFFILNKPAFAEGRGERLTPIDLNLESYQIVLIKPTYGVPTKVAFSGIIPKSASYNLRDANTLPIKQWKNYIVNDFEVSVFKQYPELEEIKQELYKQGAIYASMSGSGSTVFGIFPQELEINLESIYPDYIIAKG